jgi:large subunit ribosomal protein L13
MKPNKTYSPKAADIQRDWYVVDATDLPLGRLASEVAQRLRGKHKPTFAPHVDGGDFVVVVNAEKVAVTSGKSQTKIYYRHSGYPGGIKAETFESLRERRPEAIVERAVRGMLPKNKLGRAMIGKLKVYAGAEHPHAAQAPEVLVVGGAVTPRKDQV